MREGPSRDDAFTAYVQARGPALRRTAVHLCAGDETAADDLLQNTLIRTYGSWANVRGEDKRDAYVRRIMVRLSYRQSRRPLMPWRPAAEVESVERAVVDRHEVWSFLSALPPRQRAVMVLRYYEDLSERDIAEVMGCSIGSVKTHASRALAALRRHLGATEEEGIVRDHG